VELSETIYLNLRWCIIHKDRYPLRPAELSFETKSKLQTCWNRYCIPEKKRRRLKFCSSVKKGEFKIISHVSCLWVTDGREVSGDVNQLTCISSQYTATKRSRGFMGSFWYITRYGTLCCKHSVIYTFSDPRGWCYSTDGHLGFYWFRSMHPPERFASPWRWRQRVPPKRPNKLLYYNV
jgi:hypothetical protein